jgi:hypothetical protein
MERFVCPKRQNERGAAVFIVVMVVSLLTAVGIFAARSASLVDVASGHGRQAMQTQYVGEYGAIITSHELGTEAVGAYAQIAQRGTDDCAATRNVNEDMVGSRFCYAFHSGELQERFGSQFFEPAASTVPGSLDPFGENTPGEVGARFVVDMTEAIQSGRVPGSDLSSGTLVPLKVTLTARGFVSPPSTAANAAQACQEEASAGGIQEIRAHLTLPSVPQFAR